MRASLRRARARRSRPAAPPSTDLRDERSLRAAYATHADELYRFALRELRDEGWAQDVVQEVFLRAWWRGRRVRRGGHDELGGRGRVATAQPGAPRVVETYLRGRSYAEVSAQTGVPVGTLRTRAFYGLKALRVVLDEMGFVDCSRERVITRCLV